MHFTVEVTNLIHPKGDLLIRDIEIIDFWIGLVIVRNLVRIQIDQLTV